MWHVRYQEERKLAMGVWDLMMFQQKIDKWMKLALDESFSEDDRAFYLKKA
jgi:hypothetical protein